MERRLFRQLSVVTASKIIALVFLYLIGLSLVPVSASADRVLSLSSPGTAAATGREDPAR